jgi:hypothetical protein
VWCIDSQLTLIHLTERIEKWDISTTIGDIFLHHTDFLSRYRYAARERAAPAARTTRLI